MALPPPPPELLESDNDRAPPGSGLLLALCGSAIFWTTAVIVTLWLR